MANSASARKRARQQVKRRAHNVSRRSAMRTAIKALQKLIEKGDIQAAQAAYPGVVSIIDRTAKGSAFNRNTANRLKSRLNSRLKKLAMVAA